MNNAFAPCCAVYSQQGKTTEIREKTKLNQIIQIGANDDTPTPFRKIRRQVRERLTKQRPDLPHDEIERRVNRIMSRGMRPAA